MNMEQNFKDQNILRWFSLSAPFMGSVKSLNVGIGIDTKQPRLLDFFGVHLPISDAYEILDEMAVGYAVTPRGIWMRHQNSPWMEELKMRIANGSEEFTEDSVLKIFPKRSE
jgi:hypothetical protein